MTRTYTFYGTVSDADDYFSHRLFETVWTQSTTANKTNALLAATRCIDSLNFKGYKATINNLPDSATEDEVIAAWKAQPLEFPRGSTTSESDTTIPDDIVRACYEIAYSLLSGKDPETELESLYVTSQAYAQVRTSYDRGLLPLESVLNMVPSAIAYNLLLPYLRDERSIEISRVS